MTAHPPVTIERGEGWTNRGWEANVRGLEYAVFRAKQWIDDNDLVYAEEKKGTIHRAVTLGGDDDVLGRAHGVGSFSVHVETADDHKPLSVRRLVHYSGVMVHELGHCVRLEYQALKKYLESMATEAVAYPLELSYARFLNPKLVGAPFADLVRTNPEPELDQQFKAVVSDSWELRAWAETEEEGRGFSNGITYGSQVVNQHMHWGVPMAQLVQMPAEEVFGI